MLSLLSKAVFLTPAETHEIRGQPAYLKTDLLKFKTPTKSQIHNTREKRMH